MAFWKKKRQTENLINEGAPENLEDREIHEHIETAEDEDEIVVVISAAITMFSSEHGGNFKIRSIKRIGSNFPAWNFAGLYANLNSGLS
jgi:hypothetical protein